MLGQLFLVCLGATLALGIGTKDILNLRQEIAEIQKQIQRYVYTLNIDSVMLISFSLFTCTCTSLLIIIFMCLNKLSSELYKLTMTHNMQDILCLYSIDGYNIIFHSITETSPY